MINISNVFAGNCGYIIAPFPISILAFKSFTITCCTHRHIYLSSCGIAPRGRSRLLLPNKLLWLSPRCLVDLLVLLVYLYLIFSHDESLTLGGSVAGVKYNFLSICSIISWLLGANTLLWPILEYGWSHTWQSSIERTAGVGLGVSLICCCLIIILRLPIIFAIAALKLILIIPDLLIYINPLSIGNWSGRLLIYDNPSTRPLIRTSFATAVYVLAVVGLVLFCVTLIHSYYALTYFLSIEIVNVLVWILFIPHFWIWEATIFPRSRQI